MFERNLASALVGAAHPASQDTARGSHVVRLLVTTLGGYAYGLVAGQLARAVATWFGAEHAARARSAACTTPPEPPQTTIAELGATLRSQLGLVGEQLRDLVATVVQALPADPRRHASLSDQLSAELDLDDRLALEITTGWHYACAVIERRAITPTGSPRARELWRTWSRLAGHGEAQPATSPPGEHIMRIG